MQMAWEQMLESIDKVSESCVKYNIIISLRRHSKPLLSEYTKVVSCCFLFLLFFHLTEKHIL